MRRSLFLAGATLIVGVTVLVKLLQPSAGRPADPPIPPVEITYPEIRAAATNTPAQFAAVARRTAAGDPRLLVQFAEIGVNAGLQPAADELLEAALAATREFGESFHIMRLAYKCRDPALAKRAAETARIQSTTEFQRDKLAHFQSVYENRWH